MYWILSNELVDEDNDADLSGEANFELGDTISFKRGVTVSDLLISKITLILSNDSYIGRMTDHLSITELYGFVFSEKLRGLLQGLSVDNIQYFDLDIVNKKNGISYTDYKIGNIVGLVDCINKDLSDVEYFNDGGIEFIDKLVLDETKIPSELKKFRLLNRTTLTFVHQSIKDAINESDITGCLFYKPEEYQV